MRRSPFEPWATNTSAPVLEVEGLVKHFPLKRRLFGRDRDAVRAVDGVSFSLRRGTTFGLVGESGCGKTTTGRLLLRLERPTAGAIEVDGVDIASLEGEELRRYRRRVQMVFQDPNASLDPKMTVAECVSEPLTVNALGTRLERRERVADLLHKVGLDEGYLGRYPHQLSGGQRQRVGIARALALGPEIIVADEPTSALDVSVRAQVINLLRELQGALDLSYIFISHDLSTVRYISDEVAVMYLGQIVERAPSEELFAHPLHPYTVALLSAVPVPDPAVEATRASYVLEGEIPSPAAPPPGCRFHTRCPLAIDHCREEPPALREVAPGHMAACHLV